MKFDLYLLAYTKINSKWTKNWNVRAKTINLLEGSKGVNLYDLGLSNGFLIWHQNKQKKKNRKNGPQNLKSFVIKKTPLRKQKENP